MAEEKVKNKNNLLITAILVMVVGAAAFYGGMQYQKSQRFASFGNGQNMSFGNQGARQGGQSGMRGGSRPVMGEILSKDDKSVTIKLPDGSSKIFFISDKTAINKASAGSLADLKTGEKVAAFGTQNSDGSVTAQNIQLNPQTRMFQRESGTQNKQ
jgi:hypothetical protein